MDTGVDVPGEVWLAAGVQPAEVVGVELDLFGDGSSIPVSAAYVEFVIAHTPHGRS